VFVGDVGFRVFDLLCHLRGVRSKQEHSRRALIERCEVSHFTLLVHHNERLDYALLGNELVCDLLLIVINVQFIVLSQVYFQ